MLCLVLLHQLCLENWWLLVVLLFSKGDKHERTLWKRTFCALRGSS